MCASYIGGSVNFFATANIVSTQMMSSFQTTNTFSAETINNLLSAMATADLLVMAIYFGGLTAMSSWKRLALLFPGRQVGEQIDVPGQHHSSSNNDNDSTTLASSTVKFQMGNPSLIASCIIILFLTYAIVETSIFVEDCTSRFVPGMCCASVAAMGTTLSTILKNLEEQKWITKRQSEAITTLRRDLSRIGPSLSEFCFLSLFGAIGVSANLGTAFSRGVSSVIFAILALTVHSLTIGLGSWVVMKVLPRNKVTKTIFPLAAEEILVASNAGIGGASTAAAFAGNFAEDRVSSLRKRGLIYAGTVWGVIGYGKSRFSFL